MRVPFLSIIMIVIFLGKIMVVPVVCEVVMLVHQKIDNKNRYNCDHYAINRDALLHLTPSLKLPLSDLGGVVVQVRPFPPVMFDDSGTLLNFECRFSVRPAFQRQRVRYR